MTAITQNRPSDTRVFLTPLFFSLVTVFILFFLDEGYYDLRWMKEPGNWIPFVIYNLVFYAVYGAALLLSWLLCSKLILRNYPGENKARKIFGLSLLLGPGLLMLVFFWKVFSGIYS